MIKIAIIVGEFHKDLMDEMITVAKNMANSLGAEITDVIWAPGSLEAPLAIKRVIISKQYDAICLLGYIEKGETLHGEVMGNQVMSKVLDLQLQYDFPIGFGIIGPGATLDQAKLRIKSTAEKAVRAAIAMHNILNSE